MSPRARTRAPAPAAAPRAAKGWTCPVCGRKFVHKVAEHTCGRYTLASHFEGKPPEIRAMFDRLIGFVRAAEGEGGTGRGGRATVTPLKTMITLSAPAIFGGATARRACLRVTLVLPRSAEHPACAARKPWGTAKVWHEFVFRGAAEMDADFAALVHEAHAEARASA